MSLLGAFIATVGTAVFLQKSKRDAELADEIVASGRDYAAHGVLALRKLARGANAHDDWDKARAERDRLGTLIDARFSKAPSADYSRIQQGASGIDIALDPADPESENLMSKARASELIAAITKVNEATKRQKKAVLSSVRLEMAYWMWGEHR